MHTTLLDFQLEPLVHGNTSASIQYLEANPRVPPVDALHHLFCCPICGKCKSNVLVSGLKVFLSEYLDLVIAKLNHHAKWNYLVSLGSNLLLEEPSPMNTRRSTKAAQLDHRAAPIYVLETQIKIKESCGFLESIHFFS